MRSRLEKLMFLSVSKVCCSCGVYFLSNHVRSVDKLAALWPFLGIVGEVVILCAIIFIYEKRRNKPDFEESETDNAEG